MTGIQMNHGKSSNILYLYTMFNSLFNFCKSSSNAWQPEKDSCQFFRATHFSIYIHWWRDTSACFWTKLYIHCSNPKRCSFSFFLKKLVDVVYRAVVIYRATSIYLQQSYREKSVFWQSKKIFFQYYQFQISLFVPICSLKFSTL